MSEFIEEKDLDYDAIFKAGGKCFGNEDFYTFACPNCRHVYLLEYECGIIFVDGNDLDKREYHGNGNRLICVNCDYKFSRYTIFIGTKAPQSMKVDHELLASSNWRWIKRENA